MKRKKICQICGGNLNEVGTVHYSKISDNIGGGKATISISDVAINADLYLY